MKETHARDVQLVRSTGKTRTESLTARGCGFYYLQSYPNMLSFLLLHIPLTSSGSVPSTHGSDILGPEAAATTHLEWARLSSTLLTLPSFPYQLPLHHLLPWPGLLTPDCIAPTFALNQSFSVAKQSCQNAIQAAKKQTVTQTVTQAVQSGQMPRLKPNYLSHEPEMGFIPLPPSGPAWQPLPALGGEGREAANCIRAF